MNRYDQQELLRGLDQGISLSSVWYTGDSILDHEILKVFRKSWQYVGPIHELAEVGDYISSYVGEIPVVVVRNERGIEGFVNVCRHRRHEVMKGCGNAKLMQCAYHAWTYDLHGCLKAAPRADREATFNPGDYPLLPLKAERLGPFVFVNADPDALPLEHYFGTVLEIISASGLDIENLKLWRREAWQSEANWKTLLENFLECYHCPVAHPGFSAAIDVDQDSYRLTAHEWFSSQVGNVRQSALQGKSKVPLYDVRGVVHQAQYHLLWPNFTISINPGFPNLSVDLWQPDGPGRTKGISEQFFGPDVDETWAEELYQFNKTVGEEDDELTNSVQRSLKAGIPAKGRLLTNCEHLIVHFQKLVVKALVD